MRLKSSQERSSDILINMNIYEISMKSYNFEKMKHFYTNILQMELIMEEEHIFSVMAGTTRLNFERDFQQPFYYL